MVVEPWDPGYQAPVSSRSYPVGTTGAPGKEPWDPGYSPTGYVPVNTGYADGSTPIGDSYAPGSFTPEMMPAGIPAGAIPYVGTTQQQATGITTIDTTALAPTSGYDTLRLGNQGYGNSAYSLQAAYAQIGIGQAPPTLGNHSGGGYNNGGRFIRSGPVAPQQAGAPFGLQGLQIT